jgi:VanZ family protein
LSLAICIIYAVSDELHQLFVPGRGCQLKDVIIDTAGAVSGTAIYNAVNILRTKH